jgi:hypothetical protein
MQNSTALSVGIKSVGLNHGLMLEIVRVFLYDVVADSAHYYIRTQWQIDFLAAPPFLPFICYGTVLSADTDAHSLEIFYPIFQAIFIQSCYSMFVHSWVLRPEALLDPFSYSASVMIVR